MHAVARGTFEVTLQPQPISEVASGGGIGRLSIDKRFSGDLTGTSVGEMLSSVSPVKGSAGYVALERVTGAIGSRAGTFTLQHSGTMDRGRPALIVAVVPDSGTDGFLGISGDLTIEITDGKHFYTFTYALPEPNAEA